jgi:hypothetical protein
VSPPQGLRPIVNITLFLTIGLVPYHKRIAVGLALLVT